MESIELPDSYEETCLFLMAVEPHLVHVIWDVDPDLLKGLKDQGRDDLDPVRFILRFHDVTGIIFDGEKSNASFDVAIEVNERKRYVPLKRGGRAYLAEIGTINATGSFSPIAQSNVTETPRIGIIPETERHFAMAHEVAAQEDFVTEVPPEPLSQDRLSVAQENVPAPCAAMDDDVDLRVVQGRVSATGVIMNDEPEKILPEERGNMYSILARDVLKRSRFFHRSELGAEQVFRPQIFATRVIEERAQKMASAVDLTERSEKTFVAGISSK